MKNRALGVQEQTGLLGGKRGEWGSDLGARVLKYVLFFIRLWLSGPSDGFWNFGHFGKTGARL